VKPPRPDLFGRRWQLPDEELCEVCGQPDSYNDCNHKRLPNAHVRYLQEKQKDSKCRHRKNLSD
jgi:hypothetical protein